jgi:hypothetical protein
LPVEKKITTNVIIHTTHKAHPTKVQLKRQSLVLRTPVFDSKETTTTTTTTSTVYQNDVNRSIDFSTKDLSY